MLDAFAADACSRCEEISAFPAREMYGGNLHAAESVKDRKLEDIPDIDTSDAELLSRIIFFDTAGQDMFERTDEDAMIIRGDSKYNENEADIVVKHAQKLSECIAVR